VNSFRSLLLPFSALYGLVISARNWFFDIGVLRVTRLKVPVLSVGNISSGGTGKTPFVEMVVRKLLSKGRKPAVLSRGYGRTSHGFLMVSVGKGAIASAMEAGDEPVQVANRLSTVIVAVGEDRVNAARRILVESSADCIVLDDGFQHRYLHRDLNIVLVTAGELMEKRWLLPAGNQREHRASLKRADIIVISKCDDLRQYESAKEELPAWISDRAVGIRLEPRSLRNVSTDESIDRYSLQDVPVMIFSGLGDPSSFKRSVEECGCKVVKVREFPDHHWYSADDLSGLRTEFNASSAKFLITTEKDLVRLQALEKIGEEFVDETNLHVLETDIKFIAGEKMIDEMIEKVMN
jgi:tetraacyldisaccharide 4'-kinase